jgi:ribonuclease Z
MDHFIGFDALLRVNVGREKLIRMFGPEGFRECVHHKLQAYAWDLSDRYSTDLIFDVTEIDGSGATGNAIFRFKNRFSVEAARTGKASDGRLLMDDAFTVKAAVMEHHGPCLGFAVEERAHVNVWKNRLEERALEALNFY